MAKAKFGLNDILNAKSRAAAAGRVEDYEEIYLSPYEVRAAPENTHQSLENIEELADSFLHVGQEQPTVIASRERATILERAKVAKIKE